MDLSHAPTLGGATPRQRITPELEQRLCLTATLTGSFEAAGQRAAQLSEARARRWLAPLLERLETGEAGTMATARA